MSKLGIFFISGAFLLFGGSAFAQSVNVDNNTNSSSQAGATAIAVGGGGNSPSKIKTQFRLLLRASSPQVSTPARVQQAWASAQPAGVWALAALMKCVNVTAVPMQQHF
jgi:hypothetical protein